MRFCEDPCCGKQLRQRNNEDNKNFKKRTHCSRQCAMNHVVGKKGLPPDTTIKPKYTGLKNLCTESNPDVTYGLPVTSGYVRPIPFAKTEDEIDRMHEYNKMMGRQ